ncbi:MAG: DUF4199 family protein [Flavobacteriales bacterium]|nr:DUF4199 family protein [Flavobacteriales bacterium]
MKLSLITLAAVIAVRLALFGMGRPPEGTDFMLVHFLAIVTIVFFTGQNMLRGDKRIPFPDILRDGFRNGAVYALLFAAFIFSYYRLVEPTFFAERIDALVAAGTASGNPEEVIRPRLEKFFTPFNYASMTFFSLLIVAAFNALVLGLLHHKVLRRYL